MVALRAGEVERVAALPGGHLPYVLRRSPRARRLRVTIDAHRGVVVSLPLHGRGGHAGAEREAERFLAEREAWVRRHLGSISELRARLAARGGLVDGGSLRFRGELHRLRVEEVWGRRSSVERVAAAAGDELHVRLAGGDRRDRHLVLKRWLAEHASFAVDREIDRHAAALGVRPARIALRDPRTRWGSASRDGRLMFSWRLVLAPPEALETVVVHELAHLRVMGHGPAFWRLVASRRHDHLEWRGWLRRHSLELHAALEP